MGNRTFCDYCDKEIVSTNESDLEVTIEGEPKDMCSFCAGKVKEVLDSLKKDE